MLRPVRPSRLAATVLALGLLLGACAQAKDPSAKDVRADLSAALQDGDDGLSKAEADCYAKLVVDEVGADEINDIGFSDKEPESAVAKAIGEAAVTARAECLAEG